MPGALADIRVIEVGTLLAGPFCGQLLADHGAEVIKVEPPGSGDPMRAWGQEKADGKSLWWPVVGRGKKSVTINLREQAGQDLVRRLAAGADVLLENFRPGTLERWGLDPEDLQAANPKLIVTRVSGYGQTGPYSSKPGFGNIGEAMGGIRYTTGDPEKMPSRTGISIGDTLTAMFATIGTLNALHARERTGRGQIVDAALYESVLAVMESLLTEYHVAGFIRERTGSMIPNIAPANAYPTRDGRIHLISGNQDTVWRRMAEAMGRPELGTDPRFATHIARGDHQQDLDEMIAAWTATLDADELRRILDEYAVPNGQIYRAPEMLADEHFADREAIAWVDSADFGAIPMQNIVPKLSGTPGSINWSGPALGEHNDEVLGGILGLDAGAVERLRADGIVA
ncbi:MAG: CoA transferase [Acidimicrobiaceae bacterium]|nr:CoA transferase [Acidimicrobiaceae bacterium]MDE0515238.1 CoA transferase [Acidimicrobiaceae bacterium]MDE0657680.1 CoA transferase [Acidimicrobiaceae bacterium]MXZ95872.1 CoA transferase [Acidimicrobiaceae bacterium]MYF41967.1 CoA transferase [Acidimicrobiaceae bacterium]